MAAVQMGRIDLVEFLVSRGADLNARDANGRNIVSYAMKKPDILSILFHSGARPR